MSDQSQLPPDPVQISPDGKWRWNGAEWIPFRKPSHKGRNIAIVLAGFLVLGVISAIASSSSSPSPNASTSSSPVATTPKPPSDPHALTVANVKRSINDNADYTVAILDGLDVRIDPDGTVNVWTKPLESYSETQDYEITARNAYAVSRGVQSGWFKGVTKVVVRTRIDVADKYGKQSVDDRLMITILSSTASQFSWNGLGDRVISDPTSMYCIADDLFIPIYISTHLSSSINSELAAC